jgi:predicted Co/Zn/Cd cation transporter (cation efflux family)
MTDQNDGPDLSAGRTEQRALQVSKWTNLGLAIAGVTVAWASNSQAMLVDGLFSFVGFLSAIFAARISAASGRGPDRLRPFGYAADEALYQTFRALALLGLVIYGMTSAAITVARHAFGQTVPAIDIGPITLYMLGVAVVCAVLAVVLRMAWIRSGRRSEILHLEYKTAVYDGVLTLGAGAGLLAAPLLLDTPAGWFVPVIDSILVFVLCGAAIASYLVAFRGGVAQLAGVTAAPADILRAFRAVRPVFAAEGGTLVDLAMTRLGRRDQVVLFFHPDAPIDAATVDRITTEVAARLGERVGPSDVLVVLSRHGRSLAAPDL